MNHVALGNVEGPARRWKMRQWSAANYPLDRAQALETLAHNALMDHGRYERGVMRLPMAMPGTRISE